MDSVDRDAMLRQILKNQHTLLMIELGKSPGKRADAETRILETEKLVPSAQVSIKFCQRCGCVMIDEGCLCLQCQQGM